MGTYAFESIANDFCAHAGATLVEPVGKGAFKETFHIREANGDSAALKVYTPTFSSERTAREIDAMLRCSHPNIAKLSSITPFDSKGVIHMISIEEYLAGGSLTERLQSGALSRDELLDIGEQLIEALTHIASHDLVHRDFKPDNIMFRADRTTPVVVDFGLVRDLRQLSLTQSWLQQGPGTPLFAPAEQLLNEKPMVDWRSDQFSLGVLLSFAAFDLHPYQRLGETVDLAVGRVAQRTGQSADFERLARASNLPALLTMTAPWPVLRFQSPAVLLSNWRHQRGTI